MVAQQTEPLPVQSVPSGLPSKTESINLSTGESTGVDPKSNSKDAILKITHHGLNDIVSCILFHLKGSPQWWGPSYIVLPSYLPKAWLEMILVQG